MKNSSDPQQGGRREMNVLYEIIGLAVTLLGALAAYFRSDFEHRKTNALLVSVLGIVLTLLIGLRFESLPRLFELHTMSDQIKQHERLEEVVKKLHRAMTTVEDSRHKSLQELLFVRFDRLENYLGEIANGRFIVDEKDVLSFAMKLIDNATKSFTATSYVRIDRWWDTPRGREYEERNLTAVENRGVRVERIFIFDSETDYDSAVSWMENQREGGIHVATVMSSDLGPGPVKDLVVIDDQIAGELELTPEGFTRAEFFINQAKVREIKRGIERVAELSNEFPRENTR